MMSGAEMIVGRTSSLALGRRSGGLLGRGMMLG